MKAEDEEFGPDRGFEFLTDDEENQAETVADNEDEYSDDTFSERNPSDDNSGHHIPWPQSYRQTMDMYTSVTPPKIGFLTGTSYTGLSNSFLSSSAYKRTQASQSNASLTQPFIPVADIIDKVGEPRISSTSLSRRCSSSPYQRSSFHELLPPAQDCSYAQSVLNGINILCGVGLLSTPFAVKEGGWMSLWILVGFSIISCYTGVLLKRCLESIPGLQTYPDIGQAAFGVTGRLFVAIMLYLELYVGCVELITLMGDNMSSLFPNGQMNFVGIHLDSHKFFTILMTIILLPTTLLRNLSFLSYLSGGGVVASLLVMLCLLWVGVVDQVGFHAGGTALDLANIPVSLGIYGFCFSGHAVFPNIYTSMKKPSDFSKVLVSSFIICTLLYTGVAICGFAMFGDSVESQFTLNMPKQFVASKIAVWTTVVNPLTKYALTFTPIALSLEELLPPCLRSHCVSVIIRTSLVASMLVVSLTFPFFGFVLALVGSFLTMFVTLIFPCACYLKILGWRRLNWLQISVCIFIIIVGAVCSCIGTYSAVIKIAGEMG